MKLSFALRTLAVIGGLVLVVLTAAALYGWRLTARGFGARDSPSRMESLLAGKMRSWSIPASVVRLKNPLPNSPEVLAEGRAHWADHCASCHANDGSGKTQIGQNLYPRAPDMRLPATQLQPDGALFYVIQNGVRLTGMPAWGSPGTEDESWALVRFIRHLPRLTPAELEEMQQLNPKSPAELREEQEEEQFLNGGEAPDESSTQHHQP